VDNDIERLRWQCRRGLLELDYLFADYLDQQYAKASTDEQAAFRALLDQQDPDLQHWLINTDELPPEPKMASLVKKLRQR
jgi:antitoxin CptB